MAQFDLADGKYTVVIDMYKVSALRYSEPWRDFTGDKLMYLMASEILMWREYAEKHGIDTSSMGS